MSYLRFGAMIATSTVVMFILMYLNTYAFEHVFFSETRTYMALLMGATMAVIMLSFMLGMYSSTRTNIAIFVGAVVVFALSLWLVRSQATVGQVSFMRAMIPHHSIAVMTSERAQITDPRVRKLADEIIAAQRREIAEMRYLIAELEDGGADAPQMPEETPPRLVSLQEAISGAQIALLDPAPMSAEEIGEVVPAGPQCAFRLTSAGRPVLAAGAEGTAGGTPGVIKLNGNLLALQSTAPAGAGLEGEGVEFAAEGIRMSVMPVPEEEAETRGGERRRLADLRMELERGLTVGYRGYYRCGLG
ncbi:DUF305 domain-containing protein [Afifella pfennigii]|uniref:DUF305 domain-containing protein n=1 Tax=Afifella pfennigii TaxID=209897 RepID=UPI00047B47C1|nr:DUF305 domain-containing protein [Afifella pfennigii]